MNVVLKPLHLRLRQSRCIQDPQTAQARKLSYKALHLTRKTIARIETSLRVGYDLRIAKSHFPQDEQVGREKGLARLSSFRFNTSSLTFFAVNKRASQFQTTPTTPHILPAFDTLTGAAAESGSPAVKDAGELRREMMELMRQLWALQSENDILLKEISELKLLLLWTVRGSRNVVSPGIRWERMKDGPAFIKTLTGLHSAEIFEALHNWLEVDHTLSGLTLLDASIIRYSCRYFRSCRWRCGCSCGATSCTRTPVRRSSGGLGSPMPGAAGLLQRHWVRRHRLLQPRQRPLGPPSAERCPTRSSLL